MFRLKTKTKSEAYPLDVCAASRCNEPTGVIDASKRFWLDDVPLCDRHWAARCAEDVDRLPPKRQPILGVL